LDIKKEKASKKYELLGNGITDDTRLWSFVVLKAENKQYLLTICNISVTIIMYCNSFNSEIPWGKFCVDGTD